MRSYFAEARDNAAASFGPREPGHEHDLIRSYFID
jgi:hypothetical protein